MTNNHASIRIEQIFETKLSNKIVNDFVLDTHIFENR